MMLAAKHQNVWRNYGRRHTAGPCSSLPLTRLLTQQTRPQGEGARWTADAQSGRQGGLGDEDLDVAVFRFTLGIPGFEDRFIPRVVGAAGAALVALNHVLGAQPAPAAQVRAEYLILGLAILSVLVPEVEERLREALPGRGRQRMADKIEGATNGFLLQPGLSDAIKQELAWASVSLIKNTNSCGVMVVRGGQVVLARGALPTALLQAQPKASLDALTKELSGRDVVSGAARAGSAAVTESGPSGTGVYLPDRSAMSKAQLADLAALPQGVQSVLVQPLPSSSPSSPSPSYMLVYSERPRSLSDKERKWAAAVGAKLANLLSA